MENIVGIFRSVSAAERAVDELVRRGMAAEEITLLSSEAPQSGGTRAESEQALDGIRTTGKETANAGKDSGTALGMTIGGSAGFAAGATAATLMVPGLGAIFAIGLGAAALLGLAGGAVAGKVGDTIDRNVDTGASQEQVELYRELLRHGRSLVLAQVRGGTPIKTAREVFQEMGSEDVEAARREMGRAA